MLTIYKARREKKTSLADDLVRLQQISFQYFCKGYGRDFMLSACRKVLKIELKIKEKKNNFSYDCERNFSMSRLSIGWSVGRFDCHNSISYNSLLHRSTCFIIQPASKACGLTMVYMYMQWPLIISSSCVFLRKIIFTIHKKKKKE